MSYRQRREIPTSMTQITPSVHSDIGRVCVFDKKGALCELSDGTHMFLHNASCPVQLALLHI